MREAVPGDLLHLIDRLEELVAESRRMPIGQGIVVDRRRILELVDHMRSSVPWEVRDAREIVATREGMLEEARREGEGIIHRAELEAEARMNETIIVKKAEEEAEGILNNAAQRAQQMLDEAQQQVQARLRQADHAATNQMDEADRYALEMLRRLEQQLAAFSTTVHAGIESLEGRAAENEDGSRRE